LSPGWT